MGAFLFTFFADRGCVLISVTKAHAQSFKLLKDNLQRYIYRDYLEYLESNLRRKYSEEYQ